MYVLNTTVLISNTNSYKAALFFINTSLLFKQEQIIEDIGFGFRRLQKGVALSVKATQNNVYIVQNFN